MILGLTTRKAPIPHEEGEWVEVRTELTPHVLARSREAFRHQALRTLVSLGQDVREAIDADRAASPPETNGTRPDPLADVDLDTAVSHMVIAWSYRHPVTGKPIPPSVEMVQALDSETSAWLHGLAREALRPMVETDPGN